MIILNKHLHSRGLFIFLIFISLLAACDDPAPYGDLEVRVFDDNGKIIESGEASLYLTQTDYFQETNAFKSVEFDNELGEINFFNLPDSVYYINVISESLDNWETQVRLGLTITQNGFRNEIVSVIKNSKSGILSRPQGRDWQITQISFLGSDITKQFEACFLDNIYTFYKSGNYINLEGLSKCEANAPDTLGNTSWSFNEDQTLIQLEGLGSWNIIRITDNEIEVVLLLDETFVNVIFQPL